MSKLNILKKLVKVVKSIKNDETGRDKIKPSKKT